MDPIDRQEAIDVLKAGEDVLKLGEEILNRVLEDTEFVRNERHKYKWCHDWIESCILGIEDLPPAQPERKKGKWVDNTYCSECGWANETDPGFIGSVDGFNFCPRCGIDMREDE